MNFVDITYQVSLSDFRKATYYCLFLRHRRSFIIILIAVAITLMYLIANMMRIAQINYVVYFIGAIHMMWGASLLIGAEKSIRRYGKSSGHFLGTSFHVQMDEKNILIRVPERGVNVKYRIHQLYCVFELSALFMIYVSPAEVYLIPKKELSNEVRMRLRTSFREIPGNRFRSRF